MEVECGLALTVVVSTTMNSGSVIEAWTEAIVGSLGGLWSQLLGFLPELIGAFVIFFVGLIVATGLEKLAERIIFYLKIDVVLRKAGLEEFFKRIRVRLNSGHFVGRIVFWFITISFLLAASDVLRFSAFSGFLREVLSYIPNVFIAALILIATLYVAHFLRGLTRASVLSTGTHAHAARVVGAIAWWGVTVFGFLAALIQLEVAREVITALVYALLAMFAIAGGLAFGLGGRDFASRLLKRVEDVIVHRDDS